MPVSRFWWLTFLSFSHSIMAMNTVNQTLRFLVIFLSITTAILAILLANSWIRQPITTDATGNQIQNIIKSFSLQEFPSDEKLEDAQLKGIVLSLDDPYSEYLTPDETDQFRDNLNQTYEGIGIRFKAVAQGALVEEVFTEGPAERANLKKNDIITKVNGEGISGFESNEISDLIRGESGTEVTVEILREDQVISTSIERGPIQSELITLVVEENVAIIRITSFGDKLGNKLDDIAQQILSDPQINRIVVDVRGNGGGLLNESVDVISYFVNERSVVIFEKTNDDTDPVYSKSVKNSLTKYPIDVIMDEGSASASEILAGTLRYHRGSRLFGRPTFGKGTVQRIFDLQNGGALKLTVAEWLTPDEEKIPSNGYTPDIIYDEDQDILEETLQYLAQ